MKLDASVTIRDRIDDLYRSESRRVFASLVRLLNDFDLADDAMHEAYRMTKSDPGRYATISHAARVTMSRYCTDAVVANRIAGFLGLRAAAA